MIHYLFNCWSQQRVANYRVSMITNKNSNNTTQDNIKEEKKYQLRLFTLKHELRKIAVGL
jgi:hypothetical protein